MVKKERIVELTGNLLGSANSRGTEQGVFVLRKMLLLLDEAGSDIEVLEILSNLNRSLAGIEAHGYLTGVEFNWVKELRSIEEERI
jgi:hypothetical protein